MSKMFGMGVSSPAMRLALVGAAALTMAGCSSDVARFGEAASPSGPQSDLTPVASIPSGSSDYQPGYSPRPPSGSASRIVSTPLGSPDPRYSAPAIPSPAMSRPALTAPVSTGSLTNAKGWSSQGGTPVVVAQGETVNTLSTRYGVPTAALLQANGYSSASQVQPGARMVIPVYSGAAAARPIAPAKPDHAALAPVPAPAQHVAQISAPPAKSRIGKPVGSDHLQFVKGPDPVAKAAPAGRAAHDDKAPSKKTATLAPPPAAQPAPVAPKHGKQAVALAKPAAPVAPAEIDHDTKTASLPPVDPAAASDASKPEFRWPAHGRVIQGFKPGGNEGINIALPEGTAIKAAEGGVVAYAGSELKAYGNMVMITHPSGLTTIYANNGQLNVKKGEQVKRGQTIATSGQSGDVASPQLHFELRKGKTPVDPNGYLAGT